MEVHEIYQIAELISACIRGEILPAEKQQILDRWIKASEENQKLFDHFRHYRFLEQKRIAENLYDIEKAYEKFTCRRKEYIQANLPDTGRKTEKQRNIRVSGRQYVAAAIAVLLLVAGGWLAIRHIPPLLPVAEKAISPATDSARVMLIMAGGNRMDLSVLSGDTVIQQGKAKIRLNPEGGLAHESSGQTLGEVLYNQIIVPYKCEYQVMLADLMKPENLAMMGYTGGGGDPGETLSPEQYQAIVDAVFDTNGKKVGGICLVKGRTPVQSGFEGQWYTL